MYFDLTDLLEDDICWSGRITSPLMVLFLLLHWVRAGVLVDTQHTVVVVNMLVEEVVDTKNNLSPLIIRYKH